MRKSSESDTHCIEGPSRSSTPKKAAATCDNNSFIIEELESCLLAEDTFTEMQRQNINKHLDDSSFDVSDFIEIDKLIKSNSISPSRKHVLATDIPLSSKKPAKKLKPSLDVPSLLATNGTPDSQVRIEEIQVGSNKVTQEETKTQRLTATEVQNALLSNVQKPVSGKPVVGGRRMLQFDPCTTAQDGSDSKNYEETFFGLPLEVKQLIQDFKDIDKLYSWQEECLNLTAIKEKKNLIYSLPTSGGKTLVAEILILRELICNKKNAIFVLPYVSIVQEKVRSLSPFALALGFLVEEYAGSKGCYPPRSRRWKQVVYVATIEKALGLVNSLVEGQRLHELGLAVVDELHMIGEAGRGATLETLLTRLMYATNAVQIIGMSATIGNLSELSSFLKAATYTQNFRPVDLHEHVKLGQQIFLVQQGEVDALSPVRTLPPVNAKSPDPDQVGVLVAEVVPDSSCLVFCPTKLNCENVAQLVCKSLPKSVTDFRIEEKRALFHALVLEGGGSVCSILKRTLPYGVAYHHSGLTMSERNLLEEGFRSGCLCCLCCTSTLAAGVNLPAKRVILRSPKVGRELISLSQYKQMVGRAGRAGMDTEGESILICQPQEVPQIQALLGATMNECISQLHVPGESEEDDVKSSALEGLVLSSVCLGHTQTAADVVKLAKCSLMAIQAKRLEINVEKEVSQVISYLSEENVISCKKECDEQQVASAHLSVNALGRAAMKAHLTVTRAHELQEDLAKAQGGLNLLTPLHLLYVVTPPDMANATKFSPLAFTAAYKALAAADQKTLSLVGITEGMVAVMLSGAVPRSAPMSLLKRANVALLLRAAWEGTSVWDVSRQFELPRGDVQTLMSAAASFAANVQYFCKELPESFWCFTALLERMAERLAHCCAAELLPLMELPAVKKGRARQLYDAGYKTLNDVAVADPGVLVCCIKHLPLKVARHIISTAHMLLLERAESLREDAEVLLEGVISSVPANTSRLSSPGTPARSSQMPAPHASWASPHIRSPAALSPNSTQIQ